VREIRPGELLSGSQQGLRSMKLVKNTFPAKLMLNSARVLWKRFSRTHYSSKMRMTNRLCNLWSEILDHLEAWHQANTNISSSLKVSARPDRVCSAVKHLTEASRVSLTTSGEMW